MISMSWHATVTTPTLPALPVTDPILWLDATKITGLLNNDPVAQWDDASMNANHVTAAGVARPTYVTNAWTGLPAVQFDGLTDVMNRTTLNGVSGQTGLSIVSTFRLPSDASAFRVLCSFRDALAANVWEIRSKGSPQGLEMAVGGGNNLARTGSLIGGTVYTVTGTWSSTGVMGLWISLGFQASASEFVSIDVQQVNIGFRTAANFWNQQIMEVVAFKRPLTGPERTNMVFYLNSKWGVTT